MLNYVTFSMYVHVSDMSFYSTANSNPVGGSNIVRAPVPVRGVDDQAQQAQQRPRSPIHGGYHHNTNELVAGRRYECSQPQS